MFARERSLIATYPFRSVVRISIVGERDRQSRNRNHMNAGVKLAAVIDIIGGDLGALLRARRRRVKN